MRWHPCRHRQGIHYAMPTNTLSDHKCKAAKPGPKGQKLFDGHGLFLYVTPTGAKVWRMAYRRDGKAQTATFGPYPLLSLAEARAKRDDLRKELLNGGTVVARTAKKTSTTLAAAREQYWAGRKDLSEAYRTNAINALVQHIEPTLGTRAIDTLTRDDVLAPLNVMDAAGHHVYVRKVRMWLGQVFDWAIEQGMAKVNPCDQINPQKAFGAAPVESFASLELPQIAGFMRRLAMEGEIQSAIACKLLALTWVRTKELRFMEWTEIEGDLWRIPKGKMKRKRDHLVPLSRQALQLIERMKARSRGSIYVFPSDRRDDRTMSENAVLYLIDRIGFGGQMTGHGWRTVGSTWANESGFNRDAIERQLAHSPDDKVRATYNRAEFLPERRAMLQAWADWLMS